MERRETELWKYKISQSQGVRPGGKISCSRHLVARSWQKKVNDNNRQQLLLFTLKQEAEQIANSKKDSDNKEFQGRF